MNLPSPIRAYFNADERGDDDALTQTFASDAVIEDEVHTHAGHQAIGAWWRETKDKYQTVLQPLEMEEEGDVTKVRARVTGQFPGSPTLLSFLFRLDGNRITRLEIRP